MPTTVQGIVGPFGGLARGLIYYHSIKSELAGSLQDWSSAWLVSWRPLSSLWTPWLSF